MNNIREIHMHHHVASGPSDSRDAETYGGNTGQGVGAGLQGKWRPSSVGEMDEGWQGSTFWRQTQKTGFRMAGDF